MISKVINKNGQICFQIGNEIVDALAMKSFRPTAKNVGEFYRAGVRFFHVYCSGLPSGLKVPYSLFGETWFGDHQYDFTNLDRQIDFFKENAPNGYVFVNIHMDTRTWWLEQNPGNPNSFTHLSQTASNEKWKKDTADYIKALIKHTEEKYPDFVVGYFLLGGYTTEWFSEFDHEESNPYKLDLYRKHLHDDTAYIPGKDKLEMPKEDIFLKDNKEEVIRYRKFHNNLVADTVLYFAHEAQSVIHHQKILGLFFGYILELLYQRLWEAAHIEFDKINHSDDIDLLATPSSYQFRGYDDTGAYMLLCDSLEKNNKACFISFDHTTFLVPTLADNPKRICGDPDTDTALRLLAQMRSRNPKDCLKTREQTLSAMRREFMQKTIKRTGMWWFDMFEGWFYDDDLMKEVKHQVELSKEMMNVDRTSVSEVAVFISGQSLYNVSKNSELNTEMICNQRGPLARMGTPYDIYSLTDIDDLDCSKYKLLIFIGCFELTDSQRKTIQNLKNSCKTLFFIGPADYSSKGIQGCGDLLEMNISPQDEMENKVLAGGHEYGYENPKKDRFYIDDETVTALGEYSSSKKTALGYIKKKDYTIIFSGMGNVSYEVLQKILILSGVHLYSKNGEAVFVCNNYVGVYSPLNKETTIYLKEDGNYKDIFTEKQYQSVNKEIALDTSSSCAVMLKKI